MILTRHQVSRAFKSAVPVLAFALTSLAASTTDVLAQTQPQVATPDKGVFAYGADVGALFPDEQFETALTFDAYGEYYVHPRISVRGMFVWANPGVANQTEDHYRQVKLLFGAAYNWRYKMLRPFAGGGAGAHFVRLKRDNAVDPDGETRGGIYFGGGSDIVLSKESAIKVELRWDVVSDPPGLPDASSASLTFGYKRYF
jgi:hypothetical protein